MQAVVIVAIVAVVGYMIVATYNKQKKDRIRGKTPPAPPRRIEQEYIFFID